MRILLRALREIAYAVGVFIVAIIVGNILYRVIADLFRSSSMDRSEDAAQGAGILFALLALVVHIAVRLFRRGKKQDDLPHPQHTQIPRTAYSQPIASNSPGLFVILVDQSNSMSDTHADSNKASFAALAVNRTIYEIFKSCMDGEEIKDRCHIAVIGYGETTEVIVGGRPSEIKNPTHGHETYKRKDPDGAGGLVEVEQTLPVWVKPTHGNGKPMGKAFELATDLVQVWTRENPDNFPPVVFNITDGASDDVMAAKKAAHRLSGFGTSDGSVLIYNCQIGQRDAPEIKAPGTNSTFSDLDAQLLFEMSSVIPRELFPLAENAGLNLQEGSRGFCMNTTPETFIKLLTFGSLQDWTGASGVSSSSWHADQERRALRTGVIILFIILLLMLFDKGCSH